MKTWKGESPVESRWRRSESDTAVKIRKVFEHLKHGKVKKDQLLIVFLVGILLLVISIPAGTKKEMCIRDRHVEELWSLIADLKR